MPILGSFTPILSSVLNQSEKNRGKDELFISCLFQNHKNLHQVNKHTENFKFTCRLLVNLCLFTH